MYIHCMHTVSAARRDNLKLLELIYQSALASLSATILLFCLRYARGGF